MLNSSLYPLPPSDVPDDLTRPSRKYRFQVFVLMLSLGLFLLLYLAILVAVGWFTYWIATHGMGKRGDWTPIINGGGTVGGGMLFLFMLKGLFKGTRPDRSQYVDLKEAEQPGLFAFIYRLCDEVGAPRPARVYVTPDVNAAVIYDTSLFNLFVPPRKHLLLGLGLVNVVNLSEFKAVLAHEFGHFAQRSLGLGRYVYVVKQILGDMVYRRDSWDDWLRWWTRWDIRLSFPAWGLTAVVWVLRRFMGGVFQGITLVDLAVSRQMEFNADDVAVSAAGSDPIVHCLCRLDFASESLSAAAQDLFTAADHGVFTRDLFYHQTASADWLRTSRKNPRLGLPPENADDPQAPAIRVFDPARGDEGTPAMWRTHPANHERESNAKRHDLRTASDGRSPWLLFEQLDRLKETVTERFYRFSLERSEPYTPRDPGEVQAFIDAEHKEMTYDPKYHGLFDDRFLEPGSIETLISDHARDWTDSRMIAFLRDWPGADLERRMEQHRQRRGEFHLLSGLKTGEFTLKSKTFTFRDEQYPARDVGKLLKLVEEEFETEDARLKTMDQDVFLVHFVAGKELDSRESATMHASDELESRYRFHLRTQELLRKLIADERRVQGLVEYLSGKSELQSADFQAAVQILNEAAASLGECVNEAKSLPAPALTNVSAGTPLSELIWEKSADLPHLGETRQIRHGWISDYLRKQNAAQNRLRRIHFKSLGNILTLQERIATDWLQWKDPPTSPGAPSTV